MFLNAYKTLYFYMIILTGLERKEAEWLLKYLELHEQRIKELKDKMQKDAKNDDDMNNLQTIPGVGPVPC
jgi:uncharacterized protein YpiB (UPF0302 family)